MIICLTEDRNDLVAVTAASCGAKIFDLSDLRNARDLELLGDEVVWNLADGQEIKNSLPGCFLINRLTTIDSREFFNFGQDKMAAFLWGHLSKALPLFKGISLRPGLFTLCSQIPLLPLQWETISMSNLGVSVPHYSWAETPIAKAFVPNGSPISPRDFYSLDQTGTNSASEGTFSVVRAESKGQLVVTVFIAGDVDSRSFDDQPIKASTKAVLTKIISNLSRRWNFDFAELICRELQDGQIEFLELSPRLLITENIETLNQFTRESVNRLFRGSTYD